MIFYFSGTGNSFYVARRIAAAENGNPISMAQAIREDKLDFDVNEGDPLGFVFPIYYYTVPSIVADFIQQARFNGAGEGNYTYAAVTCGGTTGNGMRRFGKLLKERGLTLDAGFNIVMPDNYNILFDLLTPQDKVADLLEKCEKYIDKSIESISRCEKSFKLRTGPVPWLTSALMSRVYELARSTRPFHATDKCIGCGLCERSCPIGTIELRDDRPIWKAKKCSQCLACLHRCPERAIEYGKLTVKRGRYVHPGCDFENSRWSHPSPSK